MPKALMPSLVRPTEGRWVLKETNPHSASFNKAFGFTLDFLAPQIRCAVSDYAWMSYITKTESARTIATKCRNLRYFSDCLTQQKVYDLRDLTAQIIDGFRSYLAFAHSVRNDMPLSYKSQYHIFKSVKSILSWLQVNKPQTIVSTTLFEGSEYLGINDKGDIDYLSDDVIAQINEALSLEQNTLLRCGIRILEGTGMRASELENLKIDCISKHPINGYMIEWFDFKNMVQRKPIPASADCVDAIGEIIAYTKAIRKQLCEQDRTYLMVFKDPYRSGKCKRVRSHLFRTWLKRFSHRHQIKGGDGQVVSLTIHDFRRTLASDMVSKGVDIVVVKEVMGHAFTSTTKQYYAKVKDPSMAEAFSKVSPIGKPLRQVSLEDTNRQGIDENNLKKARLSDGYCTSPFSDGELCQRLLDQGQCLTCSRFITTPEFLDVFKKRLSDIKGEMQTGAIYGGHYLSHLRATADTLSSIIKALEAM